MPIYLVPHTIDMVVSIPRVFRNTFARARSQVNLINFMISEVQAAPSKVKISTRHIWANKGWPIGTMHEHILHFDNQLCPFFAFGIYRFHILDIIFVTYEQITIKWLIIGLHCVKSDTLSRRSPLDSFSKIIGARMQTVKCQQVICSALYEVIFVLEARRR